MIKKTTLLFIGVYTILTSCTTDIEVNTPALEATKNGDLFRTNLKKAILHDNGSLVITGSVGTESISFTTPSTEKGKYKTGDQTILKANFNSNDGKFNIEDTQSEGEVIITEIHNNEVTGRFFFKNLKDSSGNTVDFTDGWFYRLPIENFVPSIAIADENQINPCLLDASLTANVDGNEMISDDHYASVFGVDDVSVLITAVNDKEEITIVFPIDVAPGNYSLTGSGDYSATYSFNDDKSSALSGTLKITSHNTKSNCISGYFEFNTRSGKTITEGSFDFGY